MIITKKSNKLHNLMKQGYHALMLWAATTTHSYWRRS